LVRTWFLAPVLDRLIRMEVNMATSPQVVALQQAVDNIGTNVEEQGPLVQSVLDLVGSLQEQVTALRADLEAANVEVPAATERLNTLDAQMDAVTAAIRSAIETPAPPVEPEPAPEA